MAKNKVAVFIERAVAAVEEIWEVTPKPVRVFFYATLSATIGLYLRGQLDARSVFVIVVTNLGIYSSPRIAGAGIKRAIK